MTPVSFKTAARIFKANPLNDRRWRYSETAAIICEMAHAISRDRHPSVSIGNTRIWWRDHAFDYNCGRTDYMGEPCNIFTYLYELANDCCEFPEYLKLLEAISLCTQHFNRVGWPKVKLTEEQKDRRRDEYIEAKRWKNYGGDIFEGYGECDDDQYDNDHYGWYGPVG